MAIIELGEWLPDQPALGNPGCTVAKNCFPAPRGFRPMRNLTIVSEAIDAQCLGGFASTDDTGNVHIYAGNDTKIYSSNGTGWDDFSKIGGYTDTAIFWDFTDYGSITIATNFIDAPQFVEMTTGTIFADLTTAFKARYVATVRDFVVFGNTWDSVDGNVPQRLRWSALGDYTDYTISATTQSDFQDTPNGGAIQAVFGGEYGVIFFERSIYRLSYVGSPLVFQFDEIASEKGLYTPGAAAQDGETIYYLDNDGFYALSGGQRITPIGNEKVDAWFFNELDADYTDRVRAAIDHENKVVTWSFPSTQATAGSPDRLLSFDFEIGRWSYAEVEHEIIFSVLSEGYTLETLDDLTTDIEGATMSVDARIQFEGVKALGVFSSNTLNLLFGSEMTATIESKEMQENSGMRSLITEVWPITDGGTTTVEIGTRQRQQDNITFSGSYDVNDIGYASTRSNGRYTTIRLTVSDDWSIVQGCETIAKRAGKR